MKKIRVMRDGRPATAQELRCAVEGEPLPPSSRLRENGDSNQTTKTHSPGKWWKRVPEMDGQGAETWRHFWTGSIVKVNPSPDPLEWASNESKDAHAKWHNGKLTDGGCVK